MASLPPKPPPKPVILFIYVFLGAIASFFLGREPGSIPEGSEFVAELCPSIIVMCIFLTSYSLFDVLGCGLAKAKAGLPDLDYKDIPARLPEEVFLAERAQANQVEQMPCFFVGIICFSTLVNGKAGALLGLIWVIIRLVYADRYRKSVGKKFKDKDLGPLTVPCYFILNTLLMGSAIHALRWMIATW